MVPPVVRILPASVHANAVVLGKPSGFLRLRLPLIHKLGAPISKARQNLAGMKGAWLTDFSGCCAETRTTPEPRGDSDGTRDSLSSAEVPRG